MSRLRLGPEQNRESAMQRNPTHLPQGACASPTEASSGASGRRSRPRCRWSLGLRQDSGGNRHDARGRRLFRPPANRRPPKDCDICISLADGHEYPDPASRWQPDGVHRPSAVFFPDRIAWSDAAVARRCPRRPGDLRIARRHVHAGGHVRRHHAAAAATGRAWA